MVDFNRRNTINRPRRQAMITLATVLILWVAFYHIGTRTRDIGPAGLDHAPRLFVDLGSASEEELQLLPDVGPKTARAWRESLDDSFSGTVSVEAASTKKDLETLPKVGPIRSVKLAPYLIESKGDFDNRVVPVIETIK